MVRVVLGLGCVVDRGWPGTDKGWTGTDGGWTGTDGGWTSTETSSGCCAKGI